MTDQNTPFDPQPDHNVDDAAQTALDHEVLAALAGINPVPAVNTHKSIGSDELNPGSPKAQSVLAAAMAGNATASAAPTSPFGPPPAANARGQRARLTAESAPAAKRRRWPMLAGVAAASAAVLGTTLVVLPDNTQPALATVHEAASRTSDVHSGRIVATFSAEATGSDDAGAVVGEVTSLYDGDDFSIAIDLDEQSGFVHEVVGDELPFVETRLVDDVVYLNQGDGEWLGIEAPEFLGDQISQLVNPKTVLETVQDLVETEEVGTAIINGEETTHFRSVTDIGEQSLTGSGWVAGLASQEGIDGDGFITVDLYINDDGHIRQLDISGDLAEDGDAASFTVETQFLDLDADVNVEAPEGVEAQSIMDGFADLEAEFESELEEEFGSDD